MCAGAIAARDAALADPQAGGDSDAGRGRPRECEVLSAAIGVQANIIAVLVEQLGRLLHDYRGGRAGDEEAEEAEEREREGGERESP